MKLFYVYQLRAENEALPFYIGKGTGKRINQHLMGCSTKVCNLKNNKIKSLQNKKLDIISEKLYESECEQSCFEMEIFLIALYGRKDIKTGILCNHTNGGEGISGHKHSEATIKKLTGRVYSEEQRRNVSIATRKAMNDPIIKARTVRNRCSDKGKIREVGAWSHYKYSVLDRYTHVKNCLELGQSYNSYSLQHGINPQTFYDWVKRFNDYKQYIENK